MVDENGKIIYNKKLELVEYRGNKKFIALLLTTEEDEDEEYYFFFMKTTKPLVQDGNLHINKIHDHVDNFKIYTHQEIYFSVCAKKFDDYNEHSPLYALLKIEANEFDSLYKLLDIIWN